MSKKTINQFLFPIGIFTILIGFYPFPLWLQGVLRAIGVLLMFCFYWKK